MAQKGKNTAAKAKPAKAPAKDQPGSDMPAGGLGTAVNALPLEQRRDRLADANRKAMEISRREAAESDRAIADEQAARTPRKQRAQKPKQRFVLLAGTHIEDGTEHRYSRDRETVVESEHPLDEMFMNKFRKLDGPTDPGRDYAPGWDRPGLADPTMAEMHPHGRQTAFTVDTDAAAQKRLAETRGDTGGGDEEEPVPAGQTAAGEEDEEEAKDLGDEVTKDFPDAKAADLKVFHKGRSYSVVHKDEPDKVLNGDDFTRKEQVEQFVKDYE